MKKIKLASAFVAISLFGMAQDPWSPQLNEFQADFSPKFGTKSNHAVDFYTNEIKRMSISNDGKITLTQLADMDVEVNRPLYITPTGAMTALPGGVTYNCGSLVPWYGGGNQNMGGNNTAGTCDDNDFILKAHNKNLVHIKSTTSGAGPYAIGVGLNNSNPGALMDISDGSTNSFGTTRMRIHGDAAGTIEAYSSPMNLISMGGFYLRDGVKGNSNVMFSVDRQGKLSAGNSEFTGKVGINTTNTPLTTLEVRDPVKAELLVVSPANPPAEAKLKVANRLLSYEFGVDAAGIGRIADGPTHYLSFKPAGYPNSYPQVWVGRRPITSPYDDFQFAVDGKLVAQSIYVITGTTGWTDYVFANDYKLPKLTDVEAFYKEHKHLPEIPSEKEVAEKGINLADMNALLLKKVEELTMYVVEQQKKLDAIQKEVDHLK